VYPFGDKALLFGYRGQMGPKRGDGLQPAVYGLRLTACADGGRDLARSSARLVPRQPVVIPRALRGLPVRLRYLALAHSDFQRFIIWISDCWVSMIRWARSLISGRLDLASASLAMVIPPS